MFYGFVFSFLVCVLADNTEQIELRIMGGQEVDIKEYPYMLSLEVTDLGQFCGASIISKYWALTAGQCVKAIIEFGLENIIIRAGSTFKQRSGSIHQPANLIVHPKYAAKYCSYDFMLIQVYNPFPINQLNIQPVKLACTEPSSGTWATVAGWGYINNLGVPSEHLLAADVRINGLNCSQLLLDESMICAGAKDRDACQGDSGGPLVIRSTRELVGVASLGQNCTIPSSPGIYSKVALVQDWIQKQTGIQLKERCINGQ